MAKYRIEIDRDVCAGDRLCTEEAPGTFEIDPHGKSSVMNPEGDPPEDILSAARKCPLQGITVFESQTGKKVWPWE